MSPLAPPSKIYLTEEKKKKQQRQLDNLPEISGMRSGNALDLRVQLENPEGSEVNGRSASVSVRTRALRKKETKHQNLDRKLREEERQ